MRHENALVLDLWNISVRVRVYSMYLMSCPSTVDNLSMFDLSQELDTHREIDGYRFN